METVCVLDRTDQIALEQERTGHSGSVTRDDTIKTVRAALRRRSGQSWSVTGGKGTAWGWIKITSPPRCHDAYGAMSEADQALLGELLGLDGLAHHQGVDVPAGTAYRIEMIARAEGRAPSTYGTPYWD